jgi:hypothetical protein
MHILLLLILLVPLLFIIHRVRAFTRPYRYARRFNRFGSYGHRFGRRRGFFGPGLLSILALVAFDRFFNGNRR